jgi:hypothetical protein
MQGSADNMPKRHQTKRIEDLTRSEIYEAIRYLEHDPGKKVKLHADTLVFCIFLFIIILGCFGCVWIYFVT